nr:putative Ig domain-containing protein [Chloroflexota bacterium]
MFSLDAGLDHVCGIRADGSIACFGGNQNGQASPPGGRFAQVACGSYSTCGVRADGTVACWGYDADGLKYPPDGPFRQVDVGFYHACGVKTDGTVACWGRNSWGQTDSPAGTFKEIRLGWDHSCGIRTDGTLACWGANDRGQSNPPAGVFTQLSVAGRTGCALDEAGLPTCWGYSTFAPGGTLAQISVGTMHRCGLHSSGSITCVGGTMDGPGQPPWGGFLSLTSNDAYSCGARADSTLVCWGKNDKGQAPRLAFSPATLPPATLGTPYLESITVTASAPAAAPYTFELVDGELPPGLGFTDNGDGSFVIEGTPTSPGSFYPTFRVSDSNPDFPMAESAAFAIELEGYTLRVYRDGAGSGTVTSAPGGIDCGSACSAPYVAGTTVALTATPDLNSTFDRWKGDCASDGSVVMDDNRQCTASFSTFAVSPSDADYYGVVGAHFHQQFEPLGGFGTITWSVDGAPAGLVMDPATGVLAGTPAEAGVFALTVTAADERGGRASVSPTLTVECTLIEVYPPPSVGRAGAPYSHRFYQSGASSAVWSLEGALPTGLGFSDDDGLLSGTPLQPGSFSITVRATDGYGCSGAAAATLTIQNEIIIVDPSGTIPGGVVGTPYVQAFTQAGAIGTVGWSVVGQPPSGLTLGATTGVLSGTPAGSGAFTFTVVATDANGVKGEAECSLVIEPAPQPSSVLRIWDAEVVEGDAGTVTVSLSVVLAPSAPGTVTLQYATANGTAVAGSDYTAATGTLTFAPGETAKTVSVSVTGDTAIEADETFFVRLSSVTGAYVVDAEGKASILNDDSALQSPPFGVVDTPADGATGVEGAIGVTGWALDDTGVNRVVVSRDPVAGEPQGARIFIGDGVFVSGTRPDVAAAFPSYPNATRAGWGYMLLTNML